MSLQKKALSGMLWSSVQTFGTQLISFVVSVVLARLLLPEEFGIMGMLSLFMGLSSILINAGLTTSLIRTESPDEADYATVFTYNMGVSVLLCVVFFAGAPYIAAFFKQEALTAVTRWMGFIFIFNAFSTTQVARFHKQLNFRAEMRASVFSALLSAVVGIGAALQGYGVMSLVFTSLSGAAVNSLVIWLQSDWKPRLYFDRQKFKIHFAFGSRMLISGVLDTLYNNAYVLLIGKFFPAAQLGFYNRADSLKQLPVNTFSSVLNKVTFPLFAEIKNDDEHLRRVFREIMQMVVFVTGPLLMFAAVLAEPLFIMLFTEKWLPAVPYFQILCITGILFPLHSYNLNILTVKGKSDLFLRLEVVKKVLLTAIIAVSFFYGIYGLLWGQVVFSFIALFINTAYSGLLIRYPAIDQFRDLLPVLLLSLFSAGVVAVVEHLLKSAEAPVALRIAAGYFTGAVVFLTFAKIMRFNSLTTLQNLLMRNRRPFFPVRFNVVERFLKK